MYPLRRNSITQLTLVRTNNMRITHWPLHFWRTLGIFGNYCILWIHIKWGLQKLGGILENELKQANFVPLLWNSTTQLILVRTNNMRIAHFTFKEPLESKSLFPIVMLLKFTYLYEPLAKFFSLICIIFFKKCFKEKCQGIPIVRQWNKSSY